MDPSLRVVTHIPLEELWTHAGVVKASRGRPLARPDVASLLRLSQVQFIVANCSEPLRWIDLASCYRFWKDEVQPHLASPGDAISFAGFPRGYCYSASEWSVADPSALPIVLLEMSH